MLTKHKLLAVVVLVATALGISPLTAQIIKSFESNANWTTNGLFSTDADDFLSVTGWQNVDFTKFYTAAQANAGSGVSAGFAGKAGSVYLGVGYFGNFWSGSLYSQKIDSDTNYNYGSDTGLAWTNQISFLAGTEAIGGVKLDIDIAGAGSDNDDNETADTKETVGLGAMEFGLSWGKSINWGGGVTKPLLSFFYNVNLQKTTSKSPGGSETTILNGVDGFFNATEYTGVNAGAVGLTGCFGGAGELAHDFALANADAAAWISYGIVSYTYDKQTRVTGGDVDYKPSHTEHEITLGFGAWYELADNLSFGWSAEGVASIINAKVTSTALTKYTDERFGITPVAAAGIVYQAIPGVFNLNGSLRLNAITYTYRKFSADLAGTGIDNVDTMHEITGAFSTASLGFTWLIQSEFTLDAAMNFNTRGQAVNLSNFSILVSYKL
jgi:hypothetical protein